MSFFSCMLDKRGRQEHDGSPLWKYFLSKEESDGLVKTLQFARPLNIDPRDATLYYSQWWKYNYNGGSPSKQEVFNSLGGNIQYHLNENEFYKIACTGAEILGVKWIKKQNTLYFRTLLLQGGLPLKHISENQGKYKDFLISVLEEQPETIEDFMFNTRIIYLLPRSSQNETVYESCLEIVKAIRNKDEEYDELFNSEDFLKNISNSLKIKSASITKKIRQSKPKNYWLLNFKNDSIKITLRLGLANSYTKDSLSGIFGFEASEREYQLYMNDNLVCVFRKMVNDQFKTDWYTQQDAEWNPSTGLPNTYLMTNGEKIPLRDFIQTIPRLDEPSLWAKYEENKWRLIKGQVSSIKEAAILFPKQWKCELPCSEVFLYQENLSWTPFEGEIKIQHKDEGEDRICFRSGVKSFDWTIISEKPAWMLKSNLQVVRSKPRVLVFDDEGYDIKNNRFKVYIRKHRFKNTWEDITRLNSIPRGCFDLKIEKDNLIAHDIFFNIDNLQAIFSNQSINSARIEFKNLEYFECNLQESTLVNIEEKNSRYDLKVNTKYSKIPTTIKGSVGNIGKKKLYFDLMSPFQGVTITDNEGEIINEKQRLSLKSLYGMRILRNPNRSKETLLKIKNSLKPDVKIIKKLKESNQPILSFKDEIVRLFYLSDVMDYRNNVLLELSDGSNKKFYEISRFSNIIKNVDADNKICLDNSSEDTELFAIPVNCSADKIESIPLCKNETPYSIPFTKNLNQFIIISSRNQYGKQIRPRFVKYTDNSFISTNKYERIENFHNKLSTTKFEDDSWKQILKYFEICVQFDLPFSTFDQLSAISRSSKTASRAFLFLLIEQDKADENIQIRIPEMEKDLGFCFHWITKMDWENAIDEICNTFGYNNYHGDIAGLISSYLKENDLQKLSCFISCKSLETKLIYQNDIHELRRELGERVTKELPHHSPKISSKYNIQIENHKEVRLLLQSPIAVAESISNIQKDDHSLWGGGKIREVIRRNIQYSQYLQRDFYNRMIFHVLKKI